MKEATSGTEWNVLADKWLGVASTHAEPQVCSPLWALANASRIRCITAASPLDLFSAHRFLLTLLYWKANAAGGVQKTRESLFAGSTPQALLDAIEEEADHFHLFDDKAPFLQDISLRNTKKSNCKSVGSFFAEFACGTNIAHFNHGDDERMRLCLPCATVGMLRIVPWSQSGGAGLSPAVHNSPPIVAMAVGRNLAETLGLNLIELDSVAGQARWSSVFKPSDGHAAIPYMEAFTWNPRRVHLQNVKINGICWRCGRQGVPVVGPIVYAKNEHTKLKKKGRKTIPFQWRDPAAFYRADAEYTTIKSYDEAGASSGRDLLGLTIENPPASLVVQRNPDHRKWLLIVPCTNPANNKSYDHRQIELESLSPEAILAVLPPKPTPWRQQEIDGWTDPRTTRAGNGVSTFVRTAVRLLTHADWAVLASAAYRPMHESPAAFDLLAGLLWPLRKKVSSLPSRNAAWLVLKLMAAVPAAARELREGGFCPLRALPKRQIDQRCRDRGVRSPYPRAMPLGNQLEAALRHELEVHMRHSNIAAVDWAGLCERLDRLLD